jgi:two-component system chemotaxis sensor kinase CheA
MNIDENMVYLFHAETVDLLDGMEASLLSIQDSGFNREHVDSIFRAVHTIKGGASVFHFKILVDFTHETESFLDDVRTAKIDISDALLTLLLEIKDHINTMLEEIIQNDCKERYDDAILSRCETLKKRLLALYESEKSELSHPSTTQTISQSKNATEHSSVAHSTTLKIESNKIDYMINLLGEMVITTASVKEHSSRINDKDLKDSVDSLYKILEELREASMKTRMVPIGDTFNRYKRVIRDLSMELDKEIELKIIGADTELDKTIIEKISDPIMHLVRNSIDHGIEDKKERRALNKPDVATITLSASHEAGNIIIKVKDDGSGLNSQEIVKKAVEKKLINSGDKLSDHEIYQLVFEAGFSTAKSVSDLSGRGVGMDVVKRNIEELRGSVDINSALGRGSTITIRLPLTLAIIDGFMVKIGAQPYIIPLEMIVECIELTQEHKEFLKEKNFLNLREHVLPVLNLKKFFGYNQPQNEHRENVVVVQFGISKVGFIVDELLGEFQTVIKPMSIVFKNLNGIGGATILGNGEVAPILDIPMLLKYITNSGV